MRSRHRFLALSGALGLGFVAACSSSRVPTEAFAPSKLEAAAREAEVAAASRFRLLASANVNGETEPCGCAVNPKGGLDRRWNYVEHVRQAGGPPLLLADAGNAFFPGLRLDASKIDFFQARARTLARGHASMGLLIHNVGALDLGLGVEFLKALEADAGLKFLSANWLDATGRPIFRASETVEVGGVKVTFVGVSGGRDEALVAGVTVGDPAAAVRAVIQDLPRDHLVVILSDLGIEKDRALWSRLDRAAIVVGAKDLSSLEIPLLAGRALFVQPQLQGQQWADLDVAWRPGSEGWYNPELAQRFSERWTRLQARRSESPDPEELAQISATEVDLARYAPVALERKSFYTYRLVDMTTAWFKKNALSLEMAKVK